MSLVFESVFDSDLLEKAKFLETTDFVRIHSLQSNTELAEKWGTRPFFLPARHCINADLIENFKIRADDVWIVGYHKAGTTWIQETVWQICNDIDLEKGNSVKLYERVPFLEVGTTTHFGSTEEVIELLNKAPSPRFIKSHLPAPLLPKEIWTVKPKIVYVARNAKDTAVSNYHHYVNLFDYSGTFQNFMDAFLNDAIVYAPFDAHIADFWNMRHEENIFFFTFEEMKTNHQLLLQKMANFFGKSFTCEHINILAEHLSFSKMSKNRALNSEEWLKETKQHSQKTYKDDSFNFIRKGKVGSFLDEMSPEMIEEFNIWIRERITEYHNGDPELLKIIL